MKNICLHIVCFFLVPLSATFSQNPNWQAFGPMKKNGSERIYKLYTDTIDNIMYIGGTYQYVGNLFTSNLATYDGHSIKSIKVDVNDCWNLGCRGTYSYLRYKDEIYAGVIRSAIDSVIRIVGIGKWNGVMWDSVGSGISEFASANLINFPGQVNDMDVFEGKLYVAGEFGAVDGNFTTGIAAWDGTSWSQLLPQIFNPNGNQGFMNAYTVRAYKGEIYLGGIFDALIDGEEYYRLIKYDGSKWKPVFDPGQLAGWQSISKMEVFQDKLYVGGYFFKAGGAPGNSIMSWDGEKWDDLGGGCGGISPKVDRLYATADKLYVAGGFDSIGGIAASHIAAWDGEKWCNLGSSVFDRAIHAVSVLNDTLYVGGSFITIDSDSIATLARYIGDGSDVQCSEPVSAVKEMPRTSGKEIPRAWLSPVPANAFVTANYPGQRITGWQITAPDGRVLKQNRQDGFEETEIVVSDLLPGIYWLQLHFNDGSWTGKFTVTR